jgi:hypothetical protein
MQRIDGGNESNKTGSVRLAVHGSKPSTLETVPTQQDGS